MIFFVDNAGTIISTVPAPVYQGSVNANNIYLVAPFAANLQVTVAFKLPNGVWTERYLMTPATDIEGVVNKQTGNTCRMWRFSLPNDITAYFGTVTAQFFFYAGSGPVVVASSSTTFSVGQGVPTILPDTPTQDIYDQIIQNLSLLSQQLNNGAFAARAIYQWNSTYTYGAGEITYSPDAGQFGAFIKSKVANNTNHPPYSSTGVLNSQYWVEVVSFDHISQGYFTELKNLVATAEQSEANAQTAAAAAAQSEAETKTAAQIISDSMTGSKVYVENETLIFTNLAQSVSVANETLIIEGGL